MACMPELRAAIGAVTNYGGLVVSFGRGSKRPVYRSPSLLITGRTDLPFVVGG
jgi:hypothetical protein